MAAVMTASRHDVVLRDLALADLGAALDSSSFRHRPGQGRGTRARSTADVDIAVLAEVFPAFAYQRTAARGLLVTEEDVVRVVDAVLMPALSAKP